MQIQRNLTLRLPQGFLVLALPKRAILVEKDVNLVAQDLDYIAGEAKVFSRNT